MNKRQERLYKQFKKQLLLDLQEKCSRIVCEDAAIHTPADIAVADALSTILISTIGEMPHDYPE